MVTRAVSADLDEGHLVDKFRGALVGAAVGDALGAAFARSWQREPDRGYGGGTASLLARLSRGTAWEAASRSQFEGQGSLGNGAAMRVAPVALHATAHAEPASVLARRSAAVTHAHPLALDGASVQAVAVATALAPPPSSASSATPAPIPTLSASPSPWPGTPTRSPP